MTTMRTHIAINAHPACVMFATTFAKLRHDLSAVVAHVGGVRSEQFQVFDPIVGAVMVDVMDDFMTFQRSAEMLRHHVAVFQDVAVDVRHWLVPADLDAHITGIVAASSAAPMLAVGSGVLTRIERAVAFVITKRMGLSCRRPATERLAAETAGDDDHAPHHGLFYNASQRRDATV